MKPGVLPRIAGIPDVKALETELRQRLVRIEEMLAELTQLMRDRARPLDDKGIDDE